VSLDQPEGKQMRPLPIIGATHTLKSDNPNVEDLSVFVTEEGGEHCMTSHWEPTSEEAKMLSQGGTVELNVIGGSHPPVKLSVRKPVGYKP